MQDMSSPLPATRGTHISLLAGPHSQGGTKSNVYAQTEVEVTFPVSFITAYTALGIASSSTPVWTSYDLNSKLRFFKNANTGSWLYWLAIGK